ncbi:MAG: carboxypeptidase-like regulatory domain-containing protein [Bacteroidota bacterium]
MKTIQESRLNAYLAITSSFSFLFPGEEGATVNPKASSAGGLKPALAQALITFNGMVTSIKADAEVHSESIKGTATDKSMAKDALAVLVNGTAASLYAYFATINNNAMLEKTNFYISRLRRLKDNDLIATAGSLAAIATTYAGVTKDYGVSEESIASLRAAILAYETAKPQPRNMVADRASVNKRLTTKFKEADTFLKKVVNKLMLAHATTDPDMYNVFLTNRSIVSNPSRGTQLKGKVISSKAPKGLANVLVTIDGGAVTVTGATGLFAFKDVNPGTVTLTFSAPGYQATTLSNISVKQGQLNNQKLELVAA